MTPPVKLTDTFQFIRCIKLSFITILKIPRSFLTIHKEFMLTPSRVIWYQEILNTQHASMIKYLCIYDKIFVCHINVLDSCFSYVHHSFKKFTWKRCNLRTKNKRKYHHNVPCFKALKLQSAHTKCYGHI